MIKQLLSQPVGKKLGIRIKVIFSRSPNDSLLLKKGFSKTTFGWSFFLLSA